jgi:hypothetical protein
MAEVGLVRFAQVALHVAQTAVPRYRTRFSKHQFPQPQWLAMLCLMRYEDWAFREAEVRLAEHAELRRALGLRSVLDYTTLYRFLRRLDEEAITRSLHEVVHRMALPHPRRRAQVAVDATGLAQGAVSFQSSTFENPSNCRTCRCGGGRQAQLSPTKSQSR